MKTPRATSATLTILALTATLVAGCSERIYMPKVRELGERVFFNFDCVVLDVCPVKIGDFSLFGPV